MNNQNHLNRLETANARLARLGIREQDLTEQFIHAGGHGGQNVNKVATAVRLRCAKVGEDIKCMEERSQSMNRTGAREILADRLEKKREEAKQSKRAEAEKLRKQKAGRPKAIKRMILKDKRMKSTKKKNRTWRQGRDE
ncbi:MAG: peptide chain release factor-like protein [Spirochaetia bacterium]|nr:peptide chain release factor-like protein [Spirochaetia bacterium]